MVWFFVSLQCVCVVCFSFSASVCFIARRLHEISTTRRSEPIYFRPFFFCRYSLLYSCTAHSLFAHLFYQTFDYKILPRICLFVVEMESFCFHTFSILCVAYFSMKSFILGRMMKLVEMCSITFEIQCRCVSLFYCCVWPSLCFFLPFIVILSEHEQQIGCTRYGIWNLWIRF